MLVTSDLVKSTFIIDFVHFGVAMPKANALMLKILLCVVQIGIGLYFIHCMFICMYLVNKQLK